MPFEHGQKIRIELLRTGAIIATKDDSHRVIMLHGVLIGPGRAERVINIAEGDNPRFLRHGIADQAVRIARTIVGFMMIARHDRR